LGSASTNAKWSSTLPVSRSVLRWDGVDHDAVLRPLAAWQRRGMETVPLTLSRKLLDALYIEAMLLSDEARSYFDRSGREERDELPALQRIGFSCESLRATTRLMHVVAWLLTRRAVDAGEISEAQASTRERRLGSCQGHDPEIVAALPETARQIVAATSDLYARVARLDRGMASPSVAYSPAQGLMERLQAAF
jgi:regulator of CtrA degradation